MSAVKSRSALRALVLTPERIPTFIIPSRSRDRIRLLSDHDDQSPDGCSSSPAAAAAASPRFHFRLAPPRIRLPHRSSDAAAEAEAAAADTDVTTRAAMSLPHVGKVSAPYGFRAVLAASPCTRRRESMYHRNKAVTVTVTDVDSDPADPPPPPLPLPLPPAGSAPRRSRVCLRPVKELGLQVMKELKKSGAALRALSPARKTDTL